MNGRRKYAAEPREANVPFSRSRYVREGKAIAEVCPEAAKRWDYEKNEGLDPHTVSYGSDKKVWWRCNQVSGSSMAAQDRS